MAANDDAVVAVGEGPGGSGGWQVRLLSRGGTGGGGVGGRGGRGSRSARGGACETALRDVVTLLDGSDFFFFDRWVLFLVSFPSFHTIEVSEAGSDSD